jgi:nifR3 family TIM-barrel protein
VELKIGPLVVDSPVVLAPMAGVTNAAFRALCREFGGGLYVSEMVSARALCEGNERTFTMIAGAPSEPIRSVQLYGVDPYWVSEAVKRVVDSGVDHIDINSGCPSPKVTRRGGGGALPAHHVLFGNIVTAAVKAADGVPVTVKMRKGIDDENLTFLDAARAAEQAGVAAIALHARTVFQLYSGKADWPAIAELKQAITSVPVLGNGDIWCGDDGVRMVEETGCDGIVVGRGCLGRPWLFRDLADALAGRPVQAPPTLGEVADIMKRHARLLVDHMGDEPFAVRDFRKHTGWYLTGFPAGGAMRRRLSMAGSLAELDELLDGLDRSATLRPGDEALPRGHSHGPKEVSLPDRWMETRDDPTPPSGADKAYCG